MVDDIVNLDYKVMPDFTRGNGSTKQEVKKVETISGYVSLGSSSEFGNEWL